MRSLCIGWSVCMLWINAVTAAEDPTVRSWIARAQDGLYEPAQATLREMPDDEKRLLALRAYLRAGDELALRWSWSADQIAAYPSTAEGRAAMTELDAVAAAFAAANPGYALHINRQPRSLELQLQHWNANASVATTAHALALSLYQQLKRDAADAVQVRQALMAWTPPAAAALAAPGLSAHGQARAFDFQIEQSGRVIAADDYASARQRWDAAGWTARLHAAVTAAGPHLSGPLPTPYEPWHYAYQAQ